MSVTNGIPRRKTRVVCVGDVRIGGDAPVVVQSMTTTDTRDVARTLRQIRRLETAGCRIARVAVPDDAAAEALGAIKRRCPVPLIADIHFKPRLALEAIRRGADGIRINPGNIPADAIREIVLAAKAAGVAIRVGVNAGSLEKDLLERHGGPTAQALVDSALRHIRSIERMGFSAMKLSVKSSDVPTMVRAYRLLSDQTDYPLHLGVTEAGSLLSSAIKSSIGIGSLLADGIGDTIRVSVTGDPVSELPLAYGILRALGLSGGVDIIACPTCGRCEINLPVLVSAVEKRLSHVRRPLKIALMGCVVNGPGEAAEADIGLAGGRGSGLLFKKGKAVRKIREDDFLEELLKEVLDMLKNGKEA